MEDAEIFDIDVLRDLSTRLREWNWSLTAHLRNRELVAVSPPGSRSTALAVDLGSTKIAGYLVDLESGKKLAAKGVMNPQIGYGEDIITRINFAIRSPDGQKRMAELIKDALMTLAQDLCGEAGTEIGAILEAVMVGNTAMHHLTLGFPVRQLALSPFVPGVRGHLNVKAREIGLNFAPGAYVYFPPNIAGFVGADHLAALMATAGEWAHGNVIVLDIGTNTEISLVAQGKITSVSCASGPAFEGYHISSGVRAAPGAIEKVNLSRGHIHYQTIDHAEPIGICGSGILDSVSQLFLAGVLDSGGRIQKGSHHRVVEKSGRLEFILVPQKELRRDKAISVTQKDVREVQLGKAAIQAALRVLLSQAAFSETEIDRVVIAGAFGSYIDISNAVAVGMLPRLPLSRFHQVGNAAGTGARILLLSAAKRREAHDLLKRIHYLELAGTPQFSDAFTSACVLGPYDPAPGLGAGNVRVERD
ncbi:MAG: ASKHA domain-containing protein [Desulfobacterales bacterium]